RPHRLEQAVGRGSNGLDLGRARQGGEDHLGVMRRLANATRPAGVRRLRQLGDGLRAEVVRGHIVPRFGDVSSHVLAHVAQTDEANLHPLSVLPTTASLMAASYVALTHSLGGATRPSAC